MEQKTNWQSRKVITTIQEKNCSRSKKKTSSTSKILKSLVDAPCSTRTIRRHLNNEKLKHEKRIHRPWLTMKHKEKRLEYARQYQTMSAKVWRKVVFSDEKKFNLDGPNVLQKYWHVKKIPEKNYSTRYGGGGSFMILGILSSSGKLKVQFVSGRQKTSDYVKMLNDLSPAREGRFLCGEE